MKLSKLIQIPNPFISSTVKRNWCKPVDFSQLCKAQPLSLLRLTDALFQSVVKSAAPEPQMVF